jgi:hypothetical protein
MNFGQAIENLKQGEKVFRLGWNGKGMFIYLVRGADVPSSRLRGEALDHVGYRGEEVDPAVKINSHIDMLAADGSVVVGWLASQTDLLSEDWETIK